MSNNWSESNVSSRVRRIVTRIHRLQTRLHRSNSVPYPVHHQLYFQQHLEMERRRMSSTHIRTRNMHLVYLSGSQFPWLPPERSLDVVIRDNSIERDATEEDLADVCVICVYNFFLKQCVRVLHCNHKFHAKCVDTWFLEHRQCPLCRQDIDRNRQLSTPPNEGDYIAFPGISPDSNIERMTTLVRANFDTDQSNSEGSSSERERESSSTPEPTVDDEIPSSSGIQHRGNCSSSESEPEPGTSGSSSEGEHSPTSDTPYSSALGILMDWIRDQRNDATFTDSDEEQEEPVNEADAVSDM